MKVVLHLAVSHDGFIARTDGDSSWVSSIDEQLFMQRARELGGLVVGRKTFEQYKGEIYPVPGSVNIVLTREHVRDAEIFSAASAREALSLAEERGCSGLLVAGGAETAKAFLAENLVDEVFLSIHEIVLGEGIRSPFSKDAPFVLIDKISLSDGVLQEHWERKPSQ